MYEDDWKWSDGSKYNGASPAMPAMAISVARLGRPINCRDDIGTTQRLYVQPRAVASQDDSSASEEMIRLSYAHSLAAITMKRSPGNAKELSF